MSQPALRIAVQDANVLIDLELADLFELWFRTGIETHTTDLIRGGWRGEVTIKPWPASRAGR